MNFIARLFFVPAVLVAVSGCRPGGPELGTVMGTVTMDGRPLADAIVQFQPANGRPAIAITNAEGVYRLAYTEARGGALLGVHAVRITTHNAQAEGSEFAERIPAEYNLHSTLTAEVKPGKNVFDFQLHSR